MAYEVPLSRIHGRAMYPNPRVAGSSTGPWNTWNIPLSGERPGFISYSKVELDLASDFEPQETEILVKGSLRRPQVVGLWEKSSRA